MKAISFFNNNRGTGKTTLTGNTASYFAHEMGKRVLVVDCDPQCNLTQFILGDTKTINLYCPSGSNKQKTRTKTILDIVQPILDGDADINKSVKPLKARTNRFGVDLVPGHPKFSLFEDQLSSAWAELTIGKAGGFRISNWLRSYLASVVSDYDFAFIDVSPSLGALNRSVLLSTDHFITPLGADAFSIPGIRNISRWMSGWVDYYRVGLEQSQRLNPNGLKKFSIPTTIPISNGYIGFTLQQYVAKAKTGVHPPTKAYERIFEDIPTEIDTYLTSFLSHTDKDSYLGDIPYLCGLLPLAQRANAPIIGLTSEDGLVGNQFSQALRYKEIIGKLAEQIACATRLKTPVVTPSRSSRRST